MPEPATASTRTLEATAWRYAARELSPPEAAEFEARLAGDQSARDALSEAVRLSAAALGQDSPTPHRSFRSLILDRLRNTRRAYRGHPAAWVGIGAAAVVAIFLATQFHDADGSIAGREQTHTAPSAVAVQISESVPAAEQVRPDPHDDASRTAAEIWAELSTPEHVEKAHDDEARLHSHFKTLHAAHTLHPVRSTTTFDSPE
jgi:hypothetical protein